MRKFSFPDPPEVTLKLGSNLDETDIKEGDDVYFECHIKANPQAHKVMWKRNVSFKWQISNIFHQDKIRGVEIIFFSKKQHCPILKICCYLKIIFVNRCLLP